MSLSCAVSDNTNAADTNNYPDGTELHATYVAAQAAGLTRIPFIPESSVLVAANLTTKPNFFGCGETDTATVIWLPNAPITSAGGNTSTSQVLYTESEVNSMLANGVPVASQNDSDEWATSLACAVMEGTGPTLPVEYTSCFEQYCYAE